MTKAQRFSFLVLAALLLAGLLHARPGGGSSFKSSSSSGSSSSSSRSSSSSSSGSSRSSSGSGSTYRPSTGGGSTPTPKAAPIYTVRVGNARERAVMLAAGTAAGAATGVYGIVPTRPAGTRVKGSNERESTVLGLGFLFVVGVVGIGMIGLAGFLFVRWMNKPKGWSTAAQPPPETVSSARSQLEALKDQDPDFSIVLFEDFVYALYTEAHTARGQGRLDAFAPYLKPPARSALTALGQKPTSTIVVGSMSYLDVSVSAGSARLRLGLEANYTETPPGGSPQSFWVSEIWTFERRAGAKSRPPERVKLFTCPNCGAPLDRIVGSTCGYCQNVVDTGAFDWVVSELSVEGREARPPMLTGTTEETGNELPTRLDAGLDTALAALTTRDPAFDQTSFVARVRLVFDTMQVAWSSLEWQKARPFLSDNLWTAQTYWIDAYKRSGLRNLMDSPALARVELVRATSDRYYDAITVRIFASGFDYTVQVSDGAVVGGSKTKQRLYTEYWTLIRASNAKGPARTDPSCPSCGAPLEINAAGQCGHCQVKLTSGSFDWVLSRIEQDEVYEG